ncbi:MAG TPA: hypothetical protein DIU37_04580, partial [Opitutae bacterium]|nr:hypothetical protein [Opitutae bacterium]
SLFLLINGSDAAYEAWIQGQKAPVLKRASFDLLVARVQDVSTHLNGLIKEGVYQAWITALILGDMGKTQAAHRLFESMGINVVDHDMFYAQVVCSENARKELPSFARLESKAQDLLVKTADLGHWGHMTHLEGGFEMFEPLKHSNILVTDPAAFWFEAVVHSCDVAGAAGHVSPEGPVIYTENVYQVLEAVYAACAQLKEASVADAYDAYMSERAAWAGLPLDASLDQVLVRLAAMLRLMDAGSGECLQQAVRLWTSGEQAVIVDVLSIAGANRLPVTPTYVPAVFANLASSEELGTTRCERLEKTIAYGVPWVARVLRDYGVLLAQHKMSSEIPLNFNAIAGAVKVCPYVLNKFDGWINPETGAVELGSPALAH